MGILWMVLGFKTKAFLRDGQTDKQTNKEWCLWWADPSWQVRLHPATCDFPQCSGGDNQKGKSEDKNLIGQDKDGLISEWEKQKRKNPSDTKAITCHEQTTV